uniref:Membrane protein n=1 Tax=uncultured organism TaxID=155900 RepID=M1P266_9ZZZZ|nr:membrane protein [uncultured organism]
MMNINARMVGALVGFIVALLFIFFNWKVVLLVLGLSLLGYIIGLYMEAGEQVKRKLQELFSLFFS